MKISGAIRSAPMLHRSSTIKQVQTNMNEAWAQIHRALRPCFFSQFGEVLA